MFSGIIENTEKANRIEKNNSSIRVYIPTPRGWDIKLGESINIDGVCTTVEKLTKNEFSAYWMPETLRITNLSLVSENHTFNLERCLTLQTLIGGHLVSGHIDTTAEVADIKDEGESKTLVFKIKPKFTKYIIYKGSVAINGVSLTIVSVNNNSFSVSLIPHTLKNTNLGELKVHDTVNIEVDLIAKYLEKLNKPQSA